MEILMTLLNVIIFVSLSCVAIVLFTLAWKIYKCPNHLWESLRQAPHHKSYDIITRILK